IDPLACTAGELGSALVCWPYAIPGRRRRNQMNNAGRCRADITRDPQNMPYDVLAGRIAPCFAFERPSEPLPAPERVPATIGSSASASYTTRCQTNTYYLAASRNKCATGQVRTTLVSPSARRLIGARHRGLGWRRIASVDQRITATNMRSR